MGRAKHSTLLSGNDRLVKKQQADIQRLAELGKVIKGSRSLQDFSSVCDVSPSTMLRFLSGENSTASSDALIVAIAMNRMEDCPVSFRNLINAQGYYLKDEDKINWDELLETYRNLFLEISEEYMYQNSDTQGKFKTPEKIQDIIQRCILSYGYNLRIIPSLKDEAVVMQGIDYMIRGDFTFETDAVKPYGLEKWAFFDCCSMNPAILRRKIIDFFCSAYFDSPGEKGFKVSFIVDNVYVFKQIRVLLQSLEKDGIKDMVSLLLINRRFGIVTAEYALYNVKFAYESLIDDLPDQLLYEIQPYKADFVIYDEYNADLFERFKNELCDKEEEDTEC